MPQKNAFTELLRQAVAKGWCTKVFCTTCAAKEYRQALHMIVIEKYESLTRIFAEVDLSELESFPNWQDALRIALDDIGERLSRDDVFLAWMPALDSHIAVADLILFYYVRQGTLFSSISPSVGNEWTSKCIELAQETRNDSLIESLIYTLRQDYKNHPQLESLENELSHQNRKVALAVRVVSGG